MLRVDIDALEVAEVRRRHREKDLRHNLEIARRVESLYLAMDNAVARFAARQAASKTIPDGRILTLQQMIFGPLERNEIPRGSAAVLHGMLIANARPLIHHADSYLVEIHDGWGTDRRFRDCTMLGLYWDPQTLFRILWIGPVDEAPDMFQRLIRVTDNLFNWERLLQGQQKGWSS